MLHRFVFTWISRLGLAMVFLSGGAAAQSRDWKVLEDTRPPDPSVNRPVLTLPPGIIQPRVLLAGDSWAQYMWDDGTHNAMLDRYGHADKSALSQSLSSDPGPGYGGTEYAISGSEARQWVDTASYPWIANMVAELTNNPTVDTVILSIGGNDFLAGRPDGGWYKDMDLDVPGSEAAFLAQFEINSQQIIAAAAAVRPDIKVLLSTYDYPNFNTGFWCVFYACGKREDLSRDPVNDLITDAEINGMMVTLETTRIGWANAGPTIEIDNAVGLMHHFYGDGVTGAGILPRPGTQPPDYLPFPGGNPGLPSLRSNFRSGADPIHLDVEGYEYKIAHQLEGYLFPHFRGNVTETFFSQGGAHDGWTDGSSLGTGNVIIGDNGAARSFGILTFDTSSIPDGAVVTRASIYMTRTGATGTNPLATTDLGIPTVDIVSGSFGAAEVELGDATAPADFTGAGFLAGSAGSDGYAVRVELDSTALGAVNTQGITQFRMYFPSTGAGAGADAVTFAGGDAGAPSPGFPSLSSYMGTQAPFLDVTYEVQTSTGDPRWGTGVTMLANSPNPFTSSTSIRFQVANAGRVRLDIFDIQGRHVVTLRDEDMAAGGHAVTWNGRNTSGYRVGQGVYFARVRQGHETRSRRVVLLGH